MAIQKSKAKTIIIIAALLAAAIFIYIGIAKTKLPESTAKSQSIIDVTPLIVSKLQQLVTDASGGLYSLSIEQLKPDIIASQVTVINAKLIPVQTVLQQLEKERKAPDDVFTISFTQLHISGLGIADFLHKKTIRLDTIFISSPKIEVAHTSHDYNITNHNADSSLTLYQKLTKQFSSIALNAIVIKDGNFSTTNLSEHNTVTQINKVSINISDVRVDSTTQYDTSRFLFCKTATFSFNDFLARTSDSLYLFKIGSVSVSADKHQLTATNVTLLPRGNKAEFGKKLKTRGDMLTLRFPLIACHNIDWWAFINRDRFSAGEVALSNASVYDFFNRALPSNGLPGRKDNFPQQLLLQLPLQVDVQKISVKKLSVAYEEYSPESKHSGTVMFSNIAATISHVTNEPAKMKKNAATVCQAAGLFMNQVPVEATIRLYLAAPHNGRFFTSCKMGNLANTTINQIAEPMGMLTFKTGTIDGTTIQITGDNDNATTHISMLYHDLKLVPLKNPGGKGNLKENGLLGFLANTFLVKSNNPTGKKPPRQPDVMVKRDDGGSFFNFMWTCILHGVVKTIGLPKKFAEQ